MVHVENGTRNDLSPGVIIWVDVGGGGVFHYTLRKFICVDGAHFSTGRPRTWASQILHSIPPDNGVTLHSFRARRPGLFFFLVRGHSIVPRVSHSLPFLEPLPIMSWKINGPRMIRNETQTKQRRAFIFERIELISAIPFLTELKILTSKRIGGIEFIYIVR